MYTVLFHQPTAGDVSDVPMINSTLNFLAFFFVAFRIELLSDVKAPACDIVLVIVDALDNFPSVFSLVIGL